MKKNENERYEMSKTTVLFVKLILSRLEEVFVLVKLVLTHRTGRVYSHMLQYFSILTKTGDSVGLNQT